ncbi:MAG: tRNA guanosine(34) transglycosylase Tgt [Chloroflexota bacterium]
MTAFAFHVTARDSTTRARAGVMRTPHGLVQTPLFMPVGTRGSVKGLSPRDLSAAGAQIVLANAYHLSLRPGAEQLAAFGGLHRFMGWSGPLLTDSGGFQLFSLATPDRRNGSQGSLVKVTDDGAWFTSPIDGSRQYINPERSMEIQGAIGADFTMAFDECSRNDDDEALARRSMERTHAWLRRCRERWQELEAAKHGAAPQALVGIVQGGNSRRLREESAAFVASLGLPGIAIGGESIGYSRPMTAAILDWVAAYLPDDRPHYAMGIGEPEDFFAVVRRGIDMFDSVLPTRMARNGTLLTAQGRLRLLSSQYADDQTAPDPHCRCYTCRTVSRAYLRYLFKAEELLAPVLATLHNVTFCLDLMRRMRQAISEGRFPTFEQTFLARYRGVADAADQT